MSRGGGPLGAKHNPSRGVYDLHRHGLELAAAAATTLTLVNRLYYAKSKTHLRTVYLPCGSDDVLLNYSMQSCLYHTAGFVLTMHRPVLCVGVVPQRPCDAQVTKTPASQSTTAGGVSTVLSLKLLLAMCLCSCRQSCQRKRVDDLSAPCTDKPNVTHQPDNSKAILIFKVTMHDHVRQACSAGMWCALCC